MRALALTAAAFAAAAGLHVRPSVADTAGFAKAADDSTMAFDSPAEKSSVEISGYFRARGELLYNFDLDRGLDSAGQPLFPVPAGDPSAQALTGGNMRLRTDLRFRAPGTGLSAVLRTDVLDNLNFGSTPSLRDGTPAASLGQEPPSSAFRVKRAYGEAVLPLGVLSVGRQGSHWGLGMIVNGGDCEGCDGGDAADRLAFVTPLLGHIFALAYDISATGPLAEDKASARAIDIEPTDDVQNLSFAFMHYHSPLARERRDRAGRITIEYGAYLSHRWQDKDIPGDYLGGTTTGPESLMGRGFSATAADAWFRFSTRRLRVEAELAHLRAEVEQSSLVPGVEFYEPATSSQLGAAVETELSLPGLSLGLDGGFASGDPSPGFGAQASDPQANPPFDNRVDNFRFHTDYRVDRILFREIIGTVTDAVYLRPHTRVRLAGAEGAQLLFDAALIASWAVESASTPSGERALGVELDPTLRYETGDGFVAALEYALLVPMAAFDNSAAGLEARSAQLWRLYMRFPF